MEKRKAKLFLGNRNRELAKCMAVRITRLAPSVKLRELVPALHIVGGLASIAIPGIPSSHLVVVV